MNVIEQPIIVDENKEITAAKIWACEFKEAIDIYPENKENFYKLLNLFGDLRESLWGCIHDKERTKELLRIIINLCEPIFHSHPNKYDEEISYRIHTIYADFAKNIIDLHLYHDSNLNLKDDKEVMLFMVKVNESLFKYASKNLKNDEKIKAISKIENHEERVKACDAYLFNLTASSTKKGAKEQPQDKPSGDAEVRLTLINKLNSYINRIEGYVSKNKNTSNESSSLIQCNDEKSINFQKGFHSFFRESRGFNRKANYELAKYLRGELNCDNTSIRDIFDKNTISKCRDDYFEVDNCTQFWNRGINSNELNSIIKLSGSPISSVGA